MANTVASHSLFLEGLTPSILEGHVHLLRICCQEQLPQLPLAEEVGVAHHKTDWHCKKSTKDF